MKTENDSVKDGKLSDEQLGKLFRKLREIEKRINAQVITYQEAVDAMQLIIIEGEAPLHLKVIRGTHEIKEIEHFIDLDAKPFVPKDWTIEYHEKGGLWKWNPQLSLYLSKKQKKESINGYDLLKELGDQSALNANVLDHLLAYPELIPEEWKGKTIFFWGTIYRSSSGKLYVRSLGWNGSKWYWSDRWLDCGFSSVNPAALAI